MFNPDPGNLNHVLHVSGLTPDTFSVEIFLFLFLFLFLYEGKWINKPWLSFVYLIDGLSVIWMDIEKEACQVKVYILYKVLDPTQLISTVCIKHC